MLSRLLNDHDHIRKSLNLLEMQFLDLCRSGSPDYFMMLSIVVYIQEYPEQAHHPLEDAIFSILLKRASNKDKLVRELVTDHTELEIVTRELRRSIELLKNGAGSRGKLKHQLSEFLSRQRRHLYIEEIEVYPLVKRVLTEQDWKNIQPMVSHIDDPVFGERTRNDYERLYREIEGKCK